jgi:GT2 family glycosyltransferase
VSNPDIRLRADPFPSLLDALADERAAVAGPLVRSPAGNVEDSARRFPTLLSLLARPFVGSRGPDYPTDRGPQGVDWVAGMFMLFRREAFEAVKGFDEAYFLYYEDVDICDRLREKGCKVVFCPAVEILHDARRGSRRNPVLAARHLKSALRFLGRSAR